MLFGKLVAGRYRVRATIGEGAVGTVYDAEDTQTGAHVAVKALLGERAVDDEAVARFAREAKAVVMLDHPNVVQLLDHGRLDDGGCFLVFELVRGVTLRALIADGVVDARRALAIVRQLLDALDHAHAHGIVHRDVKPENIMLADGGWPDRDADLIKVLDFGVAKLVDDTLAVIGDAKLTRTGCNVFGAPLYAAPEAVLGRPVDRRADLYAVGVILCELLAGKPPFEAPDAASVLAKHASAPTPTLAQLAPDRTFSPRLEQVIADALAKDPDHRFVSAAEMATAIDVALAELDAPVAPVRSTAERAAAIDAALAADEDVPLAPLVSTGTSTVIGLGTTRARAPSAQPTAPVARPPNRSRPPSVNPTADDHRPPSEPDLFGAKRPRARSAPLPTQAQRASSEPDLFTPEPRPTSTTTRDAIALSVIAVLAFVIVLTTRGGAATATFANPAPGAKASASDLDQRAHQLLGAGDPAAAIELLETALAKPDERTNARAYLELGHARCAAGRRADGLAAYERALALDRALADDTRMQQNVDVALDSRDVVAGIVALELLAARGRHDTIIAQAANGNVGEVRHRAFAIAERDGYADRVDRIASFSHDLEQGPGCDERRAALAKLRAARNARALDVLRRVRGQYACIDRDVTAAIAELDAH